MTELRDHLKKSLGSTYTFEREIEGGGMSRVFVAEERALEPTQRRVDRLGCLVDGGVLPIADEVGPQRDAEGPIAEDEPALPLAFGEHGRAPLSEPRILQELVVRDHWVAHGDRAPPC